MTMQQLMRAAILTSAVVSTQATASEAVQEAVQEAARDNTRLASLETSHGADRRTVQARDIDPALRDLLSEAVNSSESFVDRFDAEVWLLDMSNRLKVFVKDEALRLSMLKNIHYEANRVGLAPELVLALIEVESHFDPYAISRSGAQGMMQIMPFWLDEIGHPEDNLIDMKTNLRMGCTILKYYVDMEKNNLHTALARYNGSYGSRVYSDKVIYALRNRWYRS